MKGHPRPRGSQPVGRFILFRKIKVDVSRLPPQGVRVVMSQPHSFQQHRLTAFRAVSLQQLGQHLPLPQVLLFQQLSPPIPFQQQLPVRPLCRRQQCHAVIGHAGHSLLKGPAVYFSPRLARQAFPQLRRSAVHAGPHQFQQPPFTFVLPLHPAIGTFGLYSYPVGNAPDNKPFPKPPYAPVPLPAFAPFSVSVQRSPLHHRGG